MRVYETTHKILNKEVDLEKISNLTSTEEMRDELLKLDGERASFDNLDE